MPPNPQPDIDACRDIIKSRGWTVSTERYCSERHSSEWNIELAKEGSRTITVEGHTSLQMWQKAVAQTA